MKTTSPIVNKISTLTGVAIVVANMIGTGAFTSLGFQLNDLSSPLVIITLWILGGILALSGAFSYAEVGTAIKKSGGEYIFLSQIYHPLVGYLSGWISLTVGFAAPIALSAIAVVKYFPFANLPLKWTSIVLIAVITFIHTFSLKSSSKFQNISTLLKVILILILIIIGLIIPETSGTNFTGENYFSEISTGAFAIALIYISYSYSGWNAAVYITEEFKNPKKSLPYALIGGTLLVTILYTLLQYVFLKTATISELAGQLNVGTIVVQKMFGEHIGNLFSMAISLLLISGISAMVWVGPRITSSMAKDYPLWSLFKNNKKEIPKMALWLQFGITAIFLLTGTFEQILIYCGVLLTLSSALTVFGVFVLRKNKTHNSSSGFKSPLFPLFQILFLLFSIGMIFFALKQYTFETIMGISNLFIGYGTWLINKKLILKQ
ncbi:amino acid/polyamine/organocation transporter (APC superfamily) [Tenacibaculum adriaticum]|uniref:Amino acid/polyamine/organocation transporter (APC superfamily) n=1 Tax=Tenacibaculum adriaticum TaxID=413713 RepID=A0A5S5DWG1_9FLAO|nr:amino acid permease [Tenacibaculum adriaticum]TYQ00166.1 amino acid/polyamine/organocation transporter (APC superfamily) [Tenacibaculum adriaticum]